MSEIELRRRVTGGVIPSFAEATSVSLLAQTAAPLERFDPATIDGLPPPARRLLARALPPEVPLSQLVELDMEGEIKLGGRWLPFTARQILRAGRGFVWAPIVGGRVLRFSGADAFGPDGAGIEFRLHGRIPVVRKSDDDVRRSAQGRLAAETVAWIPQALTPQAGARWTAIDDHHAIVTVDAAGVEIDVEIAVDDDGHLVRLGLKRWNDSLEPPAAAPFGGAVDAVFTAPSGVGIAGGGHVGWDWNTAQESDGVFFRYRVVDARFPDERPHSFDSNAYAVDLYWIPLGAGSPVVHASGRIFESVSAWYRHRRPSDLYHAALQVTVPDGRFAVEQAPVPDQNGAARGVVAVGPVGLRAAGRLRVFRYEIRCWRNGVIPDLGAAVDSPVRLSTDGRIATRIIDVLPSIPTPVWGRDEAGTGEMWNSNSVVAWALTRSGIDARALFPPSGGRAPGWTAGCTVGESGERSSPRESIASRRSPPGIDAGRTHDPKAIGPASLEEKAWNVLVTARQST